MDYVGSVQLSAFGCPNFVTVNKVVTTSVGAMLSRVLGYTNKTYLVVACRIWLLRTFYLLPCYFSLIFCVLHFL